MGKTQLDYWTPHFLHSAINPKGPKGMQSVEEMIRPVESSNKNLESLGNSLATGFHILSFPKFLESSYKEFIAFTNSFPF